MTSMQLSRHEEKALRGEYGEATAAAYRILIAIGEATEAEKLTSITWAHISGVNYNTIGDAGLVFLRKYSKDARVRVRTTVNPMGFDRTNPTKLSSKFVRKQMNIVRSYERMGAIASFTCIPYEIFSLPRRGTTVSFAESSAAIFSNSILGLLTNKESALSALASSVTGKSPYSDLRIQEHRQSKVSIKPTFKPKTELDYGLPGYFAGRITKDSCVNFENIPKPGIMTAKALCAAMGTSGSCGMFTLANSERKELIEFDLKEASTLKDELCTSEDGNLIILGSPQLGINELSYLSKLLREKKFNKPCMIFCPRAIHTQASEIGLTDKLKNAGVTFMCDSCSCLTPLVTKDNTDSVITNSVKAAYYLKNSNKVRVALKDLQTIVNQYST
jgi:predicted aconitase